VSKYMSRVQEIEAAIDRLPPDEFREVAAWRKAREQERWDVEMDSDNASGKLDCLFDEAEKELLEGSTREWPPSAE
jgi:hypothetical protein